MAVELVNLTGGNPYIINLISFYINDHNRNVSVSELRALINDDIKISGVKTQSGIVLQENSVDYQQIVSDIK
jgi:hypothetical protein